MNTKFRRLAIAALLAVAAGTAVHARPAAPNPAAPDKSDKLHKCRVAGLDEDLLCGQFEVYENRRLRSGRRIPLNIVVLPATGSPAEPDPMVFLAGGGVMPATIYAARFARTFATLRAHRDILLVDQRGSGRSNRLDCSIAADALPEQQHLEAYEREMKKCRAELEARADLRLYTTDIAMDDLDEVREWLGYPRVNLFGVSYGTKAAQIYLRQHPDRVRSVTLHGPMPIDVAMWPDLAVNSEVMLNRAFDLCGADARCHAAFPDPRQDLEAALKRLQSGAVTVPVTTPEGETKPFVVDEIGMRLLAGATNSRMALANMPLFIHQAAAGDFGPVAQVLSDEAPSDMKPPTGLYLSILCAETIPLVNPANYVRAAAKTVSGDWNARRSLRECALWPRADLPADFWKPVSSPVPAVIMVGELDAVTPVAYAERLAPRFDRGRLVTLPWRSHMDSDPCVFHLLQSFIAAGTSDGLDTSCLKDSPPLEFRLSLPKRADAPR